MSGWHMPVKAKMRGLKHDMMTQALLSYSDQEHSMTRLLRKKSWGGRRAIRYNEPAKHALSDLTSDSSLESNEAPASIHRGHSLTKPEVRE